jgi:hypothetical protein
MAKNALYIVVVETEGVINASTTIQKAIWLTIDL